MLLGRFIDRHLATLDAPQRAAFERLLALEDDDLLDLALGRTSPTEADTAAVLALMTPGA